MQMKYRVVFIPLLISMGFSMITGTIHAYAEESKRKTDPVFIYSDDNRDLYKKVIHLCGDSIVRGYGFKDFDHPSPLNRINDICQIIALENGYKITDIVFRRNISQNIWSIRDNVQKGLIRDGDIFIFEDAGPHLNNFKAAIYYFSLMKIVPSYSSKNDRNLDVKVILTTTPNYETLPGYYNSDYDMPLDQTGETINDAIRQVALQTPRGLLDWNLIMDTGVERMKKFNIKLMHDDGVHPNIFGNYLLAISILNYLDLSIKTNQNVYQEFLAYQPHYNKLFGFSLTKANLHAVLRELNSIVSELFENK